MGDRALVVFQDGDRYSPVTYLHWSGYEVPELLTKHRELMLGRENDVDYAAARFVGICHEHTGVDSNTGLGMWNLTDAERTALGLPADDDNKAHHMSELSHGDAGFILVNAGDFSWRAWGGYLRNSEAPFEEEEVEVE